MSDYPIIILDKDPGNTNIVHATSYVDNKNIVIAHSTVIGIEMILVAWPIHCEFFRQNNEKITVINNRGANWTAVYKNNIPYLTECILNEDVVTYLLFQF